MKKKMIKKITGIVLSLAMAISLMTGCGSQEAETKDESSQGSAEETAEKDNGGELKGSGETLTVGIQPISYGYPVVYASEKGYFEDAGLDVEYIIFDNGSSMNEGLAAQQLDIGVNGLATIYTVCGGVCDLIGESEAAMTGAIYARPDSDIVKASEIEGMSGSKESLKDVTILGTASTLTQQQAYAYMNHFDLSPGKDYEFLNMDYSTANQAFIAGEGDLISVDGLNYIDELEQAGMVKVCDYEAATGSAYCSGIVCRRDVSQERAEEVALFLQVFYKATEELTENTDVFEKGYLEYVLENGREYTEETVAAEIAARPLFTKETMSAEDYILGTSTIAAAEFFSEIGVIEKSNLENLKNINPEFLNKALDLDVKTAEVE